MVDNVIEFIAKTSSEEPFDKKEVTVKELIERLVKFEDSIVQLTVVADRANGDVTISGNYKSPPEWARHALLLNTYTTDLLKGEK